MSRGRRAVPARVERWVREAAQERCGYCLSPQRLVMARLEIEHIIPLAQGGTNAESNLWLACPLCNGHKADRITAIDPMNHEEIHLFNPRTQRWNEHFAWSDDGTHILGTTPCGRATVQALQLNETSAVLVRSYWVMAGWHPPGDVPFP